MTFARLRRSAGRALASAAALTLVLAPAARAQRRDAAVAAESAYLEALADLADGSIHVAVGKVAALEEETSAGCVRAVALSTAERLVAVDPEAALVQALLRVSVHRSRYLAAGAAIDLRGFEQTSIAALRGLGDLYLEASRRREAPTLVAGLLTYMARDIASPRSTPRLSAAQELLEEALDLDPDQVVVLHSLAVTLELLGRPGAAEGYVERLLTLAPDDSRYRLRRAVLAVKAGRSELGRTLLDELVSAADPPWVRELATQELARLLLEGGQEDAARELLRRVARERPSDKLLLLLAAALDPRWNASWAALDGLTVASAEDPGPSPRWIYEEGADREIEALRVELSDEVSTRLGALGEALGRLRRTIEPDRATVAACR